MSVIGFDLGNLFSYTACARAGGIETLANEYSARHTPTFVSFSGKQRFMGTASQQAVVTNLKNTFYNLKRFVGKSFDDPAVQKEKAQFGPGAPMIRGSDGSILFETRYMEEPKKFSPEQLVAAMLTKLKENAEAALDNKKVSDCVISVPSYYTEQQRRKLLEASQMANLNCLKLLNETTAVALSYGIYKQDLPAPEEPPRHVVFVDCGQSSFQASVVALHKGKLKMLASTSDSGVGGRDFDLRLAEKFAEEFQTKHKVDVRQKPRSFLRLLAECEKMKKTMSANATAIPINIECLVDEMDFSSKLKRDDFDGLCQDLLQRVETVFKQLLSECGVGVDQIHSIEIVGGASRIPAIKRIVTQVFGGKEPSTTLNADEAVARGCALQCAILSPTFRVKDFSIEDCQNYPIDLIYENSDGSGERTRMEVYPKGCPVPASKILTFYRKEPFSLKAVYSESEAANLPTGHSNIGEFQVQDVVPTEDGEASKVKVKVRVDLNGLFKVTQAQIVVKKEEIVEEKKEVEKEKEKTGEEKVDANENDDITNVAANAAESESAAAYEAADSQNPTPMETDTGAAGEASEAAPETTSETETASASTPTDQSASAGGDQQAPSTSETTAQQDQQDQQQPASPKKKTKIQTISLSTKTSDSSMDKSVLTHFHELENEMIAQDRQESDRQVAKNALEEYVIEMRRRCGDDLERFVDERQREEFVRTLDGVEDWLYDEGEDVQKSVYVEKLQELKKTGNPIVDRFREFQSRPKAIENLEQTVGSANAFVERFNAANGEDETIAHITVEDVGKLIDAVAKAAKWKSERLEKQGKKSLAETPAVMTSAIEDERKKLEKAVNSVVNKPKPKKKKEEKKDEEKENQNGAPNKEEKMEETKGGEEAAAEEISSKKDDPQKHEEGEKNEQSKTDEEAKTAVNGHTDDMDLD